MAYIDKHLGRKIVFNSGLRVGFSWMHCNGKSSKTQAALAAYHHPKSITWRWALSWIKPNGIKLLPRVRVWQPAGGDVGSVIITLPLIGAFDFHWQAHMWRRQ